MSTVKINNKFIYNTCKLALNEDLYPSGDITSNLIASKSMIKVKLISNDNGVIGGLKFVKMTFKILDKSIRFTSKVSDGSKIKKGQIIGIVKGNAKNILIGERVALNFLSHISGIATKTNKFVKAVNKKLKYVVQEKRHPL